jgi:hypothetical protein
MSTRVKNKEEFILRLKRGLGHPYQEIEITDEQWDDIINDALLFYGENIDGGQINKALALEYSGELELDLNALFPAYDIYAVSHVIYPESIFSIFPSAYGLTNEDIQFLFSIGKMGPNNTQLGDYSLTMQNLSVIDKVLRPKVSWRYNFNTQILYMDSVVRERTHDTNLLIIASCMVDYEGTSTGNIWSNKWLKEYTMALAMIQWGTNLGVKFSGFQIPGGGTIEAQSMVDKGEAEKQRLEEYVFEQLSFTPDFFQIHMH